MEAKPTAGHEGGKTGTVDRVPTDSPRSQDDALAEAGQMLEVKAGMLQGASVQVSAPVDSSVGSLKARLAPLLPGQPQPYQLKLVIAGADAPLADDSELLGRTALADGASLTVIIGRAVPPWAEELGLLPEHCDWLREHVARHGLEAPEWLEDDEAIWQQLQKEHEDRVAQHDQHSSWGHVLVLGEEGRAVGQVRARPGQSLQLNLRGRIWNRNCDTCIHHQLGLALGTRFLGKVYDGVPMAGTAIDTQVTIVAPLECGVHMLYRFNDLQYSRVARQRFTRRTAKTPLAYPRSFVGWLIVE